MTDVEFALRGKPKRKRTTAKLNGENGRTKHDVDKAKREQDGSHQDHQDWFKQNKFKAHKFILGCCNSTVKNQIIDMSNCETCILNKPRELLAEISRKMCNAARAKCECRTATRLIRRLLSMTQGDEEGLCDFTKRFKQACDEMKKY